LTREIATERLLLRRWRTDDLPAFARLNADRRVTEHLAGPLGRDDSDALARRIEDHFAEHDFGPWAVEVPGVAPFAGFVGLWRTTFAAHFTPCVEVAWRLAAEHWGHGYATEGARAALAFGCAELGLEEVVAFTVPGNERSRRVMEKLGMEHDPRDDFDHPELPERHALRRHVLYRFGCGADERRRACEKRGS